MIRTAESVWCTFFARSRYGTGCWSGTGVAVPVLDPVTTTLLSVGVRAQRRLRHSALHGAERAVRRREAGLLCAVSLSGATEEKVFLLLFLFYTFERRETESILIVLFFSNKILENGSERDVLLEENDLHC
jgi:hypothetical protein